MLILEEECRQIKETAEGIIYSMNDAVRRLESEVVERIRSMETRLLDRRNKLQIEKAGLALHHENQGLAIDNNEIAKIFETMELDVLELREETRELKAKLNDEERIKRILGISCSRNRNDDSEVQEGGIDDVVASGDIYHSEEAKKTTDKEILQTLQDEKALNLEDVATTSEEQQGSRKIMDVLRSEEAGLEAENMRLQIGIDEESKMVIMDTNMEVDKLNEELEVGSVLQSLSAQDVLHETEEAETLISQPEASPFQEQQDQTRLGAQNSDLEKEIQEIDKLRARGRGNALIEMIEAAKTAREKRIERTLRDMENCEQECKVEEQSIQICSDRARTLEEELRQMNETTMPAVRSLYDSLLGLKLEVEEKFRNMQMRLSACREELQKQKAELMTAHHENQKRTTMSHEMKSKMKREVRNMGTVYLEMVEEIKKSRKELHDMEIVKKMEDLAESEKNLEELNMRNKDLEKMMSDLKTQKEKDMVHLSMQRE